MTRNPKSEKAPVYSHQKYQKHKTDVHQKQKKEPRNHILIRERNNIYHPMKNHPWVLFRLTKDPAHITTRSPLFQTLKNAPHASTQSLIYIDGVQLPGRGVEIKALANN